MPSASSARAAWSTPNPLAMPDRSARRSACAFVAVRAAGSTARLAPADVRRERGDLGVGDDAVHLARAEAPGVDERRDRDVERAVRGRAHLARQREDGERVGGQRERRAVGMPVEPRQLRIRQVRGHLRHHGVERTGDGVASRGRAAPASRAPAILAVNVVPIVGPRNSSSGRRPPPRAGRRSPRPAPRRRAPASSVRRRGERSVSMVSLRSSSPVTAAPRRRAAHRRFEAPFAVLDQSGGRGRRSTPARTPSGRRSPAGGDGDSRASATSAASTVVPGVTKRTSRVITSETGVVFGSSPACTTRTSRSRSVKMPPTSRSSVMISTEPTPCARPSPPPLRRPSPRPRPTRARRSPCCARPLRRIAASWCLSFRLNRNRRAGCSPGRRRARAASRSRPCSSDRDRTCSTRCPRAPDGP